MSRDRLIVALDVPAPPEALELVDRLGDAACFYKLGMQLLSRGGYIRLSDELNQRGHKVFADLKFFDVPLPWVQRSADCATTEWNSLPFTATRPSWKRLPTTRAAV